MAKGTLGQVVKRAISDAAFRRQLQADPEGALKGFDLTGDERAALRSGDASKLTSLGIDQRMSRTFEIGAGVSAVSKWGTGSDLSMGATIPDGGDSSVTDALVSGGGGRASDALIGEASGAKGARISDAGGARAGTTDAAERLAQVNAAFVGGDSATSGRNALGDQHDIGRAAISDTTRLGQVNAAFVGADSATSGRNALGDQHDIGRAAIGDTTATGGRNALGDQHDGGRAAIGDTAAGGREGTAYITADEAGNNVMAGGSAGAQSSLDVSGQERGSAFMTADEMGNDVAARGSASYPDSADTQREALANDTTMANPEGYDKPDVDA